MADKNRFAETMGARLRQLRSEAGMSQRELSAQLGLTQTALDKYEDGLSSPSVFVVWQLAHIFDVSTDDIICDPPTEAA